MLHFWQLQANRSSDSQIPCIYISDSLNLIL
jgi:hypothetical protein